MIYSSIKSNYYKKELNQWSVTERIMIAIKHTDKITSRRRGVIPVKNLVMWQGPVDSSKKFVADY